MQLTASVHEATTEAWFTATNVGEIPVEILSVKSDCGCLSALLDQHTLYPGESASLIASVDLDPYLGNLRKQITLRSQTPGRDPETTVLNVSVSVESPLRIETLPKSHSGLDRYSLSKGVAIPLTLEVPPGWTDRLTLARTANDEAWTVTVQRENPGAGRSPPYLVARLPGNRVKHVLLRAP